MTQSMRMVRLTARWFLRNRRSHLAPEAEVARFAPAVQELTRRMPELLSGKALAEWQDSSRGFIEAGVPEALVAQVVSPGYLYSGLSVVEVAQCLDMDLDRKSTRLNSSHVAISYAVFCLKKKR